MSENNLIFTYIISIPIISIISAILTLNFTTKSKTISNTILLITKALNIGISIIIIKEVIEYLSKSNEQLLWVFQWFEVYSNNISISFSINQINATLLLIITIISLTSHINYVSNNTLEEKEKQSKIISFSAIYDALIILAIISNSYIQTAIFLLLSSIAQFTLLFNNSKDKTESNQINNMAIITVFFDYIVIIGSIIFSNSHNNQIDIINNVSIPMESKEIRTIAFCMMLAGSMFRAGIIPFSLIYFIKNKFFNDSTAKIISTGNTIIAFWLIHILIPNKEYIPDFMLISFIGILNVTVLSLSIYSLCQSNIMKITGCLSIANTAMVTAGILQNNLFSIYCIISASAIPALMLISSSYLSKISNTEEIKEINWKEKPDITFIYIMCLIIISGFPPFSGIEKNLVNKEFLSNNFHLSEIIFFFTALASIKPIFTILSNNKNQKEELKLHFNISIKDAGILFLSTFIFLIEINHIIYLINFKQILAEYNILPSILGVIFIILYYVFYKNTIISSIREKIYNIISNYHKSKN